jgi:restriction system protein
MPDIVGGFYPQKSRIGVVLSIPTYDALMLPVLKACAGKQWKMRDLISHIADVLSLSQAEREQEIPSGGTRLIANRVHWAKTYLKQAGLLEQPQRGVVQITKIGQEVLDSKISKIDVTYLRKFDKFQSFIGPGKQIIESVLGDDPPAMVYPNPTVTPDEQIAIASEALDAAARDLLLARILEATPSFFEKMIVDLLIKMGYEGSRPDSGRLLGGTGGGGVDGVIHEDQLGLDRVYLQAKRYKPGNSVGSEAVQAFIGALVNKGASKGVLMTTSNFSKSAIAVAERSGQLRLVLIDGDALTKLMLRFGVGVRVAKTVEIKRIDLDYFEEAETE